MQLSCMESCEALVGLRYETLVGSTGEAPETITFSGFLQLWETAAEAVNAVKNAVLLDLQWQKNCH